MPIYEFLCQKCHMKFSVLVPKPTERVEVRCPDCDGSDLKRVVSTFSYHKSMKTIHEESGEPQAPGTDYYKDPRNIGRWVEKKFQEMGVDMPEHIQNEIAAAREGELPQSLKEKL